MGFSATRSRLSADSYVVSFEGALDLNAVRRLKKVLFDVIAAGARPSDAERSTFARLVSGRR